MEKKHSFCQQYVVIFIKEKQNHCHRHHIAYTARTLGTSVTEQWQKGKAQHRQPSDDSTETESPAS